MYTYIPFMKLKTSEIGALKELQPEKKKELLVFFDFPKKKPKKSRTATVIKTKEELFSSDITRLESKFLGNLLWLKEFYLDNYDVEDGITHNGKYNYYSIIDTFSKFGMIPVIGLDRNSIHLDAIKEAFAQNKFKNKKAAIRLTREDFSNFDLIKDEIIDIHTSLTDIGCSIDLIFDCRVCTSNDSHKLIQWISHFIKCINREKLDFDKIITTGSSIPSSIGAIIDTKSEKDLSREEILIYDTIANEYKLNNVIFGDYTCVSPDYSDIELFDEDMQNVTTAKVMYPYGKNIFIKRGGTTKKDKNQYNEFARIIVETKSFYRKKEFSAGDLFLYEKSKYIGNGVTAASIVKPLINIHLSYMIVK